MKKFGQMSLLLLLGVVAGSFSCPESRGKKDLDRPTVVSLAPNLTEIVFLLGMGDHLAGVSDHCNYPPAAKSKPRLGGLKNISLEAVISRDPDYIFATRDGNDQVFLDELKQLNYKVYTFEPITMDQVLETVLSVGQILGVESRAELANRELKAKEQLVAGRVAGVKPVPVILAYQRQPLILAGPGTFADDLIKKAGGINLAADSPVPYPRYSLEMVIVKSPQAIIDVTMGELGAADEEARDFWSQWPDLPAVRNGKVAVLDPDLISRPGPRLFDGLIQLAKILHPEKFEEIKK